MLHVSGSSEVDVTQAYTDRSAHATGALYPLWHTVDSKSKAKATFADLCTTLPGNFSLPWTAISERLVDGKVSKLAGLGTQQRAALKFMRIYNVGENRAKKFADAGARTFADLEILADKKLISLTNGQRIGLEHLDVCRARRVVYPALMLSSACTGHRAPGTANRDGRPVQAIVLCHQVRRLEF